MLSVRKFYGDYLDMRGPGMRAISDTMGPGASNENILFSYKAQVVVHPGLLRAPKLSPRFLCLTEQGLYLIMIVVKKKIATPQLDRRIAMSLIQSVTLSPLYDNFIIIHCPMEYDAVIECDFKTELICWLRHKIPSLTVNYAQEIIYMKKKNSK